MGWPDLGFFAVIVVIAVILTKLSQVWGVCDGSCEENPREYARDPEERKGGDGGPADNGEGG